MSMDEEASTRQHRVARLSSQQVRTWKPSDFDDDPDARAAAEASFPRPEELR
jgi:hypothetical protein